MVLVRCKVHVHTVCTPRPFPAVHDKRSKYGSSDRFPRKASSQHVQAEERFHQLDRMLAEWRQEIVNTFLMNLCSKK